MQKNIISVSEMFDVSGFGKASLVSFMQLSKLVDCALRRDPDPEIAKGSNWQILARLDNKDQVIKHSSNGVNSTIREGYFLYQDCDAWVVASCNERGGLLLIAIFPSIGAYNAAEYFVWLVTQGRAKLDWSSVVG